MTVPPNALASLSIWTTVWLSAKFDRRAPFIFGAAGVAIIGRVRYGHCAFYLTILVGYIIILTGQTCTLCRSRLTQALPNIDAAGAQYVGVHFAAAGVYTGNALLLR